MNSRSQTKIRKTQQLNLIAEQRYFANKSLLKEDVSKCFKDTGINLADCPNCNPLPGQDPDIMKCVEELKSQNIDPTLVTSVITCMSKELGINIGDIQLPDIKIPKIGFPGITGGNF